MTTKRKTYSAKFKFKVALEATKNEKTRSQIASEFEVHPTQVSQWKNELLTNGGAVFEKSPSKQAKNLPKKKTTYMSKLADSKWN